MAQGDSFETIKRLFTWALVTASLVLAAKAFWEARHPLTVLNHWAPVMGTLTRREVPRNHDADGNLYFQMKGTFRYAVDGKERESTALSYFGSTDFGWIAPRALAYEKNADYPIRYDPAQPDVFEFGVGYNWVYLRTPLCYLMAAALCLLLAIPFHRFKRSARSCGQCQQRLRSFFRYCPECGESI